MRSSFWKVPYLLWFTAFSACSGSVTNSGGNGGGGSGGSGGSGAQGGSGAGTTGPECPAQPLTAGACLVPAGGFAGDPPDTLELLATVTEIGAGPPPAGCWESPATMFNSLAPAPVWARLVDETQKEWVVAFAVPTLQAGFNGHLAVGDAVQVSLSWKMEIGGLGAQFLVGDLGLSKGGALVAYVSDSKAPAWYQKGDTVCQSSDEGCCGNTSFDAEAQVNGAAGTVPLGETVEVGGLAISNLGWTDVEDLGCCNFAGNPIYVAAAAVP